MGGHALSKQPARGSLARLGLADQPPAAGHAPHHRRADRPLQIEHRVVVAGPQRSAQNFDFIDGLPAQRRFPPLLGGRKVKMIHERLTPDRGRLLPSAASSARQRGSTTQSITQSGWACRSAVTAGSACRISPMAPSRTTSKRKLDCVCKL